MLNSLSFVFPGQGSQSQGMLADLKSDFPVVEKTFTQASDALHYDLWEMVQTDPENKLDQTQFTQPAILTASVALWRIWRSETGQYCPSVLAGHSLGEYSALVCADAIAFETAVSLVAQRGQLMQSAFPKGQGAMAAILGLSVEIVESTCAQIATSTGYVAPVSYNAPKQIVIGGHRSAVEQAIVDLKALKAKRAVLLPMSVPSHCVLMREAAEAFGAILDQTVISTPRIPVIQNADLKAHEDPKQIKKALFQQLYSPIDWVSTVQHLLGKGITTVVECGPGSVLSGLNRRIDRALKTFSVYDATSLETALESI